jgi:hypothetical protein
MKESAPVIHLRAPEFAEERTRLDYSVVITNEGSETLEVYLSGRETIFDFVVTGDGGRRVYSRLEGQSTQAILRVESLAPEQSIVLKDSWDLKDSAGEFVAPGFYTLNALVMTDGEPLQSQDALLHVTGE